MRDISSTDPSWRPVTFSVWNVACVVVMGGDECVHFFFLFRGAGSPGYQCNASQIRIVVYENDFSRHSLLSTRKQRAFSTHGLRTRTHTHSPAFARYFFSSRLSVQRYSSQIRSSAPPRSD